MPQTLALVAFTPEALANLTRNPHDRSAAVRELMEATGGKLVAYYHSYGEYHAVVITEDPEDPAMGAAGAWAADSGGHLKTYKLIPLLTVDEAMEGLRKAGELGFRGPSGSTNS